MAQLFQDMKGDARSCRLPKCFKAIAAASPHIKIAKKKHFGCYYCRGSALTGVKYYRFQTEILWWESENRVCLSHNRDNKWLLLKTQCYNRRPSQKTASE